MKRYIKSTVVDLLDEDYDTLRDIALDPDTDHDTLMQLANTTGVAWDVVKNPNLSEDILSDKFAHFNDYYVNFTHGDHKLGSFESIVNWLSSSNEITMEYDTIVYSLGGVMNVSIKFAPCQTILETNHHSYASTKKFKKSSSANNKSLFAYVKSLIISNEKIFSFL